MSLVTLFTDASVRPVLGTAGWGAWAAGEGRRTRTFSGPLSNLPGGRFDGSSVLGELLAVAHALEALSSAGFLREEDDVLLLQSDCLGALAILRTYVPGCGHSVHPDGAQEVPMRSARMSRWDVAGLTRVRAVLGAHSLRLLVRHVPGHSPGDGRRWANRECDRLANVAAEAAAGLRMPHGSQETV